MKKSTKKYLDEKLVVVTDLLGEIALRLDQIEARILHEIRVSNGAELPWEYPTEMTERLEAAEGVFDEVRRQFVHEIPFDEKRSPSQPLAQTPPELLPDAANDGQTKDTTG